jgi:hypothetical protein
MSFDTLCIVVAIVWVGAAIWNRLGDILRLLKK